MNSRERTNGGTGILNPEGDLMEELSFGNGSSEREVTSKKNFENSVIYREWVIRNELALYPDNHSVSQYARNLLNRMQTDDDRHNFRITVYQGVPNAFCLPNGSLYLSDQLISLADAEEELLFVLGHEKSHVGREHSYKASKQREANSARSIVSQVLSHFGQARFYEWEADLRAFNDLERLGINPMAGVDLLEKFRSLARRGEIDKVHGKDTDRVLNLRMMTHMQDITTVQDPFHPIPKGVKTELNKRYDFTSWHDYFITNFQNRNIDSISRALSNMSGPTAALVLHEAISAHKIQLDLQSENAKRWADYQGRIITMLGQKVWNHISEVFNSDPSTKLSEQQKTFLFYSLLELTAGCDAAKAETQGFFFHPMYSAIRLPSGKEMQWTKRRLGFQEQIYTDEDVDEFLEALKPETITKLGIKLNFSPDALISNLTKRILEQEVYFDEEGENLDPDLYTEFAGKLVDAFSELYRVHGTLEIDPTAIYVSIIRAAKDKVPENIYQKLEKEAGKKRAEAIIRLQQAEVENATADEKLFRIFQRYLIQLNPILLKDQDWEIRKSFIEGVDKQFKTEAGQILGDLNLENTFQVLTFLASFRNKFMEDMDSWGIYEVNDDIQCSWSSFVYEEIINKYLPKNSDLIEGLLFRTKVAMLLQSQTEVAGVSPLSQLKYDFQKLFGQSDFTITDYEKLYRGLQGGSLDEELGVETKTIKLLDKVEGDDWPEFFRKGVYCLLDRALLSPVSKEELASILEKLTANFPFNHYGADIDIARYEGDGHLSESEWPAKNRILERIFSDFQFDIRDPRDLRTLYYLSTYFEDTSYAVRLQDIVWRRFAEQLSFSEGIDFLRQEVRGKRLLSLRAAQDYIELAANTHEQIKQAKDVIIELLTGGFDSADFGKLIVTEQFFDLFFKRSKPEFLLAIVGNGVDDMELKKYLYSRWRSAYRTASEITEWINLNDVLQKLYSLDAQKKYVLIRDLLTGENSVLIHRDSIHKERLVDFFIDNYVEATSDFEKQMKAVLRDIMKEMVTTAGYDLIYFALAPLLQNRALVTPSTRVSWKTVIENEIPPSGFESKTVLKESGKEIKENIYEEDEDEIYIKTRWDDEVGRETVERPTKESTEEIFKLINGTKQYNFIKENEESRRAYETVVQGILEGLEKKPERLKLSVTEFISEIAQTLGAPGVRFLQLIGQYVDLPPHLEHAFRDVYDKVEGQSKITADNTLLREWPEAEKVLDGLITRLGGGSLMSVFQSQHSEGDQRAVKILNPNSAFHTETTYQLLSQVFSKLSAKDPRFAPASTALEDIRDWIRGDIDFTGFLEADSRFRERHDGYSIGGRYKIKVPVSYKPENKFFAQEEYVKGINLTDIETLQNQGHDLKEIMRLVSGNFLEQVMDGLVHSDIHPGNIRVTPNSEVAFLDRNFYISLSLEDQFFLAGLTQSLDSPTDALDLCLNYLESQGAEIDEVKRARILEQAASLNNIPDLTNRMLGLTVILRKEDLRFPLKITLLVKDLFYLDRLCKKVGFLGVNQAFEGS